MTKAVRRIPIADIPIDDNPLARAERNSQVIREFAELMKAGTSFPPIVLYEDDDGSVALADGDHRTLAAREAELTDIDAEVRPGSRDDALWHAIGANTKHGLRNTAGDTKKNIETALAKWGNKVDRELAEHIGVSVAYVNRLRNQLSTVESSNAPKRKGKDGKSRPARYKKRQKAAPSKPDSVDEPPVGEEPTLAECCEADNKLIESFCRGLVKFFEDNVPRVFWAEDSGRIESALSGVRAACTTLRAAKAIVCPACNEGRTQKGKCPYCKTVGYLPSHQAAQIPEEMRF